MCSWVVQESTNCFYLRRRQEKYHQKFIFLLTLHIKTYFTLAAWLFSSVQRARCDLETHIEPTVNKHWTSLVPMLSVVWDDFSGMTAADRVNRRQVATGRVQHNWQGDELGQKMILAGLIRFVNRLTVWFD